MGRMVKCAYCKKQVDKDITLRYKEKNYHPECLYLYKDKEELQDYICKLFSLKALGPVNFRLMKNYVENYDYTFKGILNALKYHYEVKNNDIKKSQSRIGIVPYVYDEAQEYFYKLREINQKIGQNVEVQKAAPTKAVIVKKKQRKTQQQYNLLDL